MPAQLVRRVDSWINALTGLGTLRDKLTHAQIVAGTKLSDSVLEALYNDDDLAARIVDKVPREATRRGFTIELEGLSRDDSAKVARDIERACKTLHVLPKLREAWIWARLYGGGAVFVGADDGQDPALPLAEDRIQSLRFLNVLRKPQLWVRKRYQDVQSPFYGEPEVFAVTRLAGTGVVTIDPGVEIHASRLIIFRGSLTARLFTQSPDGWEDSALQRVHDVLRQTATSWQSTAHLVTDASQGVLKIANLVDLIATGGQDALRTRIEMMDMARSVCRAILVDADRENFERVATSFAGLPEMMDRFMMRAAAAAEMPMTILWGRSPAGLNATGESDIRGWYDTVEAAQSDVLGPRLDQLLRLMMLAKDGPTGGKLPNQWELRFKPLWQPTDKERADTRKTHADTVAALVNAQILLPEEAALELAKDGDFTTIDVEARQRILEAELQSLEENAGQPPPTPPPQPPPQPPPMHMGGQRPMPGNGGDMGSGA